MVKLSEAFHNLKPTRVLVAGDFMMDRYTIGKVDRISPEAPVPVMHVKKQMDLPGGAGNVALNLRNLHCKVSVLGRIGHDDIGKSLSQLFIDGNINHAGLFTEDNYHTILKNRMICDSQQLIRVDFEDKTTLSDSTEEKVQQYLQNNPQAFDVIAISDYAKGFLSDNILQMIINYGKQENIPVIVDPKGLDFSKYKGATLIKPNQKEAYAATNLSKEASIEQVGTKLLSHLNCPHLMITRSENGISLYNQEGSFHFPVHVKEVVDVTGAGDTVLSVLALGMGNKQPLQLIIPLANIAAGIAIEHVGCATITLSDIAQRILEAESRSKVLQPQQVDTLMHYLEDRQCSVLSVEDKETDLLHLLHVIQSISEKHMEIPFVLYLKHPPSDKLLSCLSSIPTIDHIIIGRSANEESLANNLQGFHCYRFHENHLYSHQSSKVSFFS